MHIKQRNKPKEKQKKLIRQQNMKRKYVQKFPKKYYICFVCI